MLNLFTQRSTSKRQDYRDTHRGIPVTTEEDNTVFVGNKPVMNYVLAVVTQFNNGAETVSIKARGKAISRAVDTTEIAISRFLQNVEKREITTTTEVVDTENGKTNVSCIEIVLGNRMHLSESSL